MKKIAIAVLAIYLGSCASVPYEYPAPPKGEPNSRQRSEYQFWNWNYGPASRIIKTVILTSLTLTASYLMTGAVWAYGHDDNSGWGWPECPLPPFTP